MGTCGDCKHWDTNGFGLRNDPKLNTSYPFAWKVASVGRCKLVARQWSPESADKMISLSGIEHTRWPVSELIGVVTRREFGCNQWRKE